MMTDSFLARKLLQNLLCYGRFALANHLCSPAIIFLGSVCVDMYRRNSRVAKLEDLSPL